MKIKKYAMVLVLMFGSITFVYGQCPVQETTIMHINGVNVITSKKARKSSDFLLEKLLSQPNVSIECISVSTLYNISATLPLDLVEAADQKMQELNRGMLDFWRVYFRVFAYAADYEISSFIGDWFSIADFTGYVIDEQLQKHLGLVRDELAQGRQVILVPHSQGNFYANAIWDALTFGEQSQVHIVSVATPSEEVADGGDYVTVEEDGIARWFFPFALPANAANIEECPSGWHCHGFQEWYLTGQNSRDQIINDIVSLLPQETPKFCIVEGVVRDEQFRDVIPGATVTIQRVWSDAPVIETSTTDANGHYCILEDDAIGNGQYVLKVFLNGSLYSGNSRVYVFNGSTTIIDFPTPVLM